MATELDSLQSQLLLEALSRLESKLDNLTGRIQTMESTMTGQIASLSERVASLQKEKEQLFKFHNDREKTISRAFEEIKVVTSMTQNNGRAIEKVEARMEVIETKIERGIAGEIALKREVELREAERRGAWGLPTKLGALAASILAIIGLIAWVTGN